MAITLTISQDPNQAVSNLIQHNHGDGGLGQPIPTTGLVNKAVTTAKIADGAITSTQLATNAVKSTNITDGSITMAKLASDVQASQSGGIINVTNYIGNGLKVTPSFSALQATVNSGRASLGEKNHTLSSPQVLPLSSRMAALAYAQYNSASSAPTLNKVNALYPALEADHVGRWLFNAKTNGTTVLDTTANANNLAINGGVVLVDGWADYGMKVDGSTGYLQSAGSTGFPTGATARSLTCIVTFHTLNTALRQDFICYGTGANNSMISLFLNTNGFVGIDHYNTSVDTLFYPQIGQTYIITYTYDGTKASLYVNGTQVWSMKYALTTGAGTIMFGRAFWVVSDWSFVTYHYADIRNTCMTASKIGQLANKALFPNTYQVVGASYPTLTEANSHEYRFADTSGTTVKDTGNTTLWNGVAGTPNTIVPSSLGLGNARLFSSATGSMISIAQPFQLTQSFTAIAVFKLTDVAAWRSILGNRNVASQGFSWEVENVATNPRMNMYDYGANIYNFSNGRLVADGLNFVAVTLDNGVLTHYINSGQPDTVSKFVPSAGALTLMTAGVAIGDAAITTQTVQPFQGQIEYFMFNNQAVMSQEEIEAAYNALMVGNVTRRFVDDVLPSPSNSVPLAFIRTDGTACREVNDVDYKYGRIEGAIRGEGNRRKFLGWRWVSQSATLYWDNPHGTDQVKCDMVVKRNLSDYGMVVNMDTIYSSGMYGMMVKGVTPHWIRTYTGEKVSVWGTNTYDNADFGGCWLGLWVELL